MTDFKAAVVRGARVALFTFLATFVPALLGALTKLQEWASSGGQSAPPDLSTLGYLAVSTALGAFSGFVGFVWNWVENRKGFAIFGAKTGRLN